MHGGVSATLPGGRDSSLSHASRRRVKRGLHAPASFRRLHLCEERIELAAQRVKLPLTGASEILELVEGEHNGFGLVVPGDDHDPLMCRLLQHAAELVLQDRKSTRLN